MKKHGKRSLALLLVLMLCLSLLPVAALAGDEAVLEEGPAYVCQIGSQGYESLADAIAAVSADSADPTEIVLIADTSETALNISAGKSVTLDLNSKTLTGTGSGSVITNSGTLTVTDNSTYKTGAITHWSDGDRPDSGGGICNTGDFTLSGGSITGCSASNCGGGVYNTGTFTMTGGMISSCDAISGGGVYNEGTFTMSGGSISGCAAIGFADGGSTGGYGGGVRNFGSFTMRGGTITGCSSTADGGGIYSSRSLTLSGGGITYCNANASGGGIYAIAGDLIICRDEGCTVPLTVTGNTVNVAASNLVLTNTVRAISFDGVPADGSKIGITTAAEPTETEPVVFTSGYGYGREGIPHPSALFVPDNGNCTAEPAAEGEAQLVPGPVISFDPTVILPAAAGEESASLTGTVQNKILKVDDSKKNVDEIKSLADKESTDLLFDVSGIKKVDGVSLTGNVLSALQESEKGLTVKNDFCGITLPAEAVGSLDIKKDQSIAITAIAIDKLDLSGIGTPVKAADIKLGLEGTSDKFKHESSRITISNDKDETGKKTTRIEGGSATVSIAADLSEIEAAGGTPSDITLMHQKSDGKWEPLPTTYTVTGSTATYVAKASEFSPFALVFGDTVLKDCPKDDTCPLDRFTDTDNTAWYHDGIHFCLNAGLMAGVSDTAFDPSGTMSRAMAVAMLWRLEGRPYVNYAMSFADVAEDTWYTEAVRWAASEGIVSGYSAEAFGPDDPVTREQLAVMLYGCAKRNGEGFTGSWMFPLDFADADTVHDWAGEAVHWCVMKGIIAGADGKLEPQRSASRAEAAAMFQRFCG